MYEAKEEPKVIVMFSDGSIVHIISHSLNKLHLFTPL
jgi:hypothetical protein